MNLRHETLTIATAAIIAVGLIAGIVTYVVLTGDPSTGCEAL